MIEKLRICMNADLILWSSRTGNKCRMPNAKCQMPSEMQGLSIRHSAFGILFRLTFAPKSEPYHPTTKENQPMPGKQYSQPPKTTIDSSKKYTATFDTSRG